MNSGYGLYFNNGSSTQSSVRFSGSAAYKYVYIFAPKDGLIKVTKTANYSMTIAIVRGVMLLNIPNPPATFNVPCSSFVFYDSELANGANITVNNGDLIFVTLSNSENISKFETDLFKNYNNLETNFSKLIAECSKSPLEEALTGYTKNMYEYTSNLENGTIANNGTNAGQQQADIYRLRSPLYEILRPSTKIYIIDNETYSLAFTFWFFDSNGDLIENKKGGITKDTGVFPYVNAKYFRYSAIESNNVQITPEIVSNFSVYQPSIIGEKINNTKIRWCAMGDSITEGWYAENGTATVNPAVGWVTLVAGLKNWTLSNNGVGGTGFVRGANRSAPAVAKDIDFSNFDIVSLAFGINDWKGNREIGSMVDGITTDEEIIEAGENEFGNLYKNMRYVIEKILRDNPYCKIFVITPINCSGYGTKEINWGIGYEFSNSGTLETVFNAEKEICEYYGLSLIDMTHSSIVNRENAAVVLGDGVHPTIKAHFCMAKELSSRIQF